MKIGYSCDLDTTASYCPFFLLKKGEKHVQISWMDANLIRVALSVVIWVGLPARTIALMTEMCIF
jgi:hypothetical protein